jgi:hypothetical protein
MGGCFFHGIFWPKSTAPLLRNDCERFHDLLDIFDCRILGMGHYMPINVGGDTRLGVPCPVLHCVDWCSNIEEQGERSMTQIVEADDRQVVLAQYLFEFLRDFALAGVGANAGREDHAILFPTDSSQGLLGFLPLAVCLQHSQADLA